MARATFPLVCSAALAFASASPARAQCSVPIDNLEASDESQGAQFGNALAVSNNTALIGASKEDGGGNRAGAAYVFVRGAQGWSERAKLLASDAAAEDRFGSSVALDGDIAVIGAHQKDSFTGAAYVFVRSGGLWVEEAKLIASDAEIGDYFGWSVAISGQTVAVGAIRKDVGLEGSAGAVYVFVRSGGNWPEHARLTASDADWADFLGWSVALSGDTVITGARGDNHAAGFGSAYVFQRNGLAWSEQGKLVATGAVSGLTFGASVALSGDTVVVSDPLEDAVASDSGAAYVFVRSGSTWSQQAKLVSAALEANDELGSQVAIAGDTILLGHPFDNTPGFSRGSVHQFARDGTSWTEIATLRASDSNNLDFFGSSVALTDDIIMIGTPGDDGPSNSGSVYVFEPGHDVGLRYCTSSPNSTGAAARIRAEGCSSISSANLSFSASPVPDTPGVFFYGPTQILAPFGNGFRCVAGATTRSPFVFGVGGTSRWTPDLAAPPHDQLAAGTTWHFQAWFRDPPAGGSEFDLSDGISLTLVP